MLIAYKYRLYPNKEQQEYFMKCFRGARFIYNRMLADKIKHYEETGEQLNNSPAQYKNEFPWLKEVDSLALKNAQLHLRYAYNNFFRRPEIGFPKFKRKKDYHYSYTTNNNTRDGKSIYILDGRIRLPKIGLVKIKKHRDFDGRIKSATVSKTPSGKYFASVLVLIDGEKERPPVTDNQIGVDLGIKEFAITSDGETIENPEYFLKSEAKLRKLKKDLSRCKEGSKNREKCRLKLAKQHEKIANQRKDFLNKLSKRLITENQRIYLEDLKVKGAMSNPKLAKSLADVSWSEFTRQLQYKADWYGREIIRVDTRSLPVLVCPSCGNTDGDNELSVKGLACSECGAYYNKDINSARSILNEGLRLSNG